MRHVLLLYGNVILILLFNFLKYTHVHIHACQGNCVMIYTYKKGSSNAVGIFNDGFPVSAVLNGYQISPSL